MNREAFKLARDTLRTAVKDYGFKRTKLERAWSNKITGYRYGPGKFEGEHWSIVHWYDAVMNGCGDEPLYNGDTVAADILEVSAVESLAFGLSASQQFAVLWYSETGFVCLEYINANQYDELRAKNAGDNGETLHGFDR